MKKKTILLTLAAAAAGLTLYEHRRNQKIPTIAANTPRAYDIHIHSFLAALENGTPFDPALLDDSLLFIHKRYDCSDFLANSIIRALYAYPDRIDDYRSGLKERLRRTLLDFKYHWDQNGSDSLCTWSENHQILFAGLEYLAGHLYIDDIFTNSGRKGTYHKERGKKRILDWCERRFRFGFTEWYSNNYYLESLVAMSNIEEFAPDPDVRHAMTQILHMIFFDMATQSLRGSFVTTGGRMYENNKKSARSGSMMNRVIAHAFDIDVADEAEPFNEELTLMTRDMDLNFILNKSYRTPEVLKLIARDTAAAVIRASNSIDIDEAVARGLFGPLDSQLAAQWEMEAWTNPPVIAHSMRGITRNNMLCSEFFAPMKALNLTILKPFYGSLSRLLSPLTDGKATQRANTYTYRTPHYLMATAQNYHPGGYSDQQHIWSCLLSDDVCVFATHPSGELQDKGALSKSPGYWVGNGRNPHAMQHENRIMAIYHLPNKKTAFESAVHHYTHAYFPFDKFDRSLTLPHIACGQAGESLVALISATPFVRADNDELKQYGEHQFWICECSSTDSETFAGFVERIKRQSPSFDGYCLTYGELTLCWRGDFCVDGAVQAKQHKRYDSPYCQGEREADVYVYEFAGERLEVAL